MYHELYLKQRAKAHEWKSAIDNKSGKTYYYNIVTKETTWAKPPELFTPEEFERVMKQKEEQIQFFKTMEENIKKKILKAQQEEERLKNASNDKDEIIYFRYDDNFDTDRRNRLTSRACSQDFSIPTFEGRQRVNSISAGPPRRIRTISTMDDEILMTMKQSNGEDRRTNLYSQNKTQMYQLDPNENLKPIPSKVARDTSDVQTPKSNPLLKRRNSTGTIYIASTMSTLDNNSTIQCVCAVIRAHLIAAAKENINPLPQYDIFKDVGFSQPSNVYMTNPLLLVPPLTTIQEFFTFIFNTTHLEHDCIIMALIYIERLIKETRGKLCIRYDNWRSIVFACLIMASKVWDDMSMWNIDFSQIFQSFDLNRVNSLELAVLEALKYNIKVSAGEYAKYYFHIRSNMVRLGLMKSEPNYIQPLNFQDAKKLQICTERYEMLSTKPKRRHHSIHEVILPTSTDSSSTICESKSEKVSSSSGNNKNKVSLNLLSLDRNQTADGYNLLSPSNKPIGLDEIISGQHMDADGKIHSIKKQTKSPIKK